MNKNYFDEIAEEISKLLNESIDTPYEYRVYYDVYGQIYATASSQQAADIHNIKGDYLVVDKDIYENAEKYKIENGAVVWKTDVTPLTVAVLKKSNAGFAVIKNNASLLVDADEQLTTIEHYDYRTR